MTDNLSIWTALGTTDPAQTKAFSRAGGFRGTAVKPMWVIKRLTEQFGPCGVGWGVEEPTFQVVEAGGEVMVYCTVRCWHGPERAFICGVGGDKVLSKRSGGNFTDDEAFKKAFTDAVMNAFKFIGVAADVHMGRFDDSKYVAEAKESFRAKLTQDQADTIRALMQAVDADPVRFLKYLGVQKVEDITDYDGAVEALEAKRKVA